MSLAENPVALGRVMPSLCLPPAFIELHGRVPWLPGLTMAGEPIGFRREGSGGGEDDLNVRFL